MSQCLAYSPDGKLFAVGGDGGVIQIMDANSGLVLRCIPSSASQQVNSLAISPDSKTLALGGLAHNPSTNTDVGVVEIWTVSDAQLVKTIKKASNQSVAGVAFSPDGKSLADTGTITTGGISSSFLEIWDVASGSQSASLASTSVKSLAVAYSPDGSMLADGGQGFNSSTNQYVGVLEIWNISTRKLVTSFGTQANRGVYSLAFTPNGKSIASGGNQYNPSNGVLDGIVEVWNIANASLKMSISTGLNQGVWSVAISPDGNTLADAGNNLNNLPGESQYTGEVQTWNISTPIETGLISSAANFFVNAVAFSPDGSTLASCGQSQSNSQGYGAVIERWTVPGYTQISSTNKFSQDQYSAVTFASDGKTLGAVGGKWLSGSSGGGYIGGILSLWDVQTGAPKASLPTSATNLYSLSFSPTGGTLACGGQVTDKNSNTTHGVVEIWDLTTKTVTANLKTFAVYVYAVAYSPDGKILAVGGGNPGHRQGVLELWNVQTKALIYSLGTANNISINAVAFAPDGKSIAVGGSGYNTGTGLPTQALERWDVAAGKLLGTFSTSAITLCSLAISADGHTLGVGGNGSSNSNFGVLELWDITNSLKLQSTGGGIPVNTVSISSQGNVVFKGTDTALTALDPTSAATLGTYAWPVKSLVVSPDSSMVGFTTVNALVVGANPLFLDPVLTLDMTPATVQGGGTSTGTITLKQAAPPGGEVVNLSTDNRAATVPATVTVAAHATTATFPISTNPVSSDTAVNVTATDLAGPKSSTLTVKAATIASISLNPNSVGGGTSLIGTVTLTGSAGPNGATVTLVSSTKLASVPPAVTISAGTTTQTFQVDTLPTAVSLSAVITASLGKSSQSATLAITPPDLASVTAGPILSDGSATGTVTLNGVAPAGGLVVKLASGNTAVKVPASVSVTAGQSSNTFKVTTSPVPKAVVVSITATAGKTVKSTTVSLVPPSLVSLAINPNSVTGTMSSVGTVKLSGLAPTGGMSVSLTSHLSFAKVPGSVKVAAGKNSATFSISTLAVSNQATVKIDSTLNGLAEAATLTILPPSLKGLTLNPTSVKGGKSSTATVSISTPAPSGGLVLTLTSSSKAATVPQSVTIPAGKTAMTFTVKTNTVGVKTQATIGLSYGGASKSAVLTIS